MSLANAHPLIVPAPQLPGVVARAVRRLALDRLRRDWSGARLDLALPSGELVRLGGRGPAEARAVVRDDRLFARLLVRGELGAGEGFVAGDWDADDVVAVIRAFLRGTRARGAESPLTWLGQLATRLRHRRAANTRDGSVRNIHAHYDLGNAFYSLFLDDATLAYSCALWPASSLAAAQQRKFDRLCDLLELSASDHVLEIGCGWGGMAIHAARTRGCRVTAITVSRAQAELARKRVAAAGLSDRVTIELRDYRDVSGEFDKLVSIEMLEAVGHAFLPEYFAACARSVRRGGRIAIQTITMPDDRYDAYREGVDWMQTYIFPGSCIPSLAAIRAAAAPLALVHCEDVGPHYAPTLRAWRDAFVAKLPAVRALGFDAPFVRSWLLYLAFSEAAFAERTLGNHHLVFAR